MHRLIIIMSVYNYVRVTVNMGRYDGNPLVWNCPCRRFHIIHTGGEVFANITL